jgi:hypothetical protein
MTFSNYRKYPIHSIFSKLLETDSELEFMDTYAHKFCNSCTRDYFNNTLAVQWPLHKSGNGLECMSLDCERMISFRKSDLTQKFRKKIY